MLDITSAEHRANPYASFKRLRAEFPVSRVAPYGYWAIAKYHDVQRILKNPDIFVSSDLIKESDVINPEFLLKSRGLIGTDRPDHTRLRRMLTKAFTPRVIKGYADNCRIICNDLIGKMKQQFVTDFIQTFAAPLPIKIISALMGFDPARHEDIKRWTTILVSWRNLPDDITDDIEEMFNYISDVIAAKKHRPENDLISSLITACDNDKIITSHELLGIIRLLLVAGTETTTHLLGNAMLALSRNRELVHRIQQDTTNIPRLIEETLRHDGPALCLYRRVTMDVEVNGIEIKKGDIVLPLLASANHDEDIFTHPEIFDLNRETQCHLAFGSGIHHCLGSQLFKLQACIAFEELLKSFRQFTRIDNEPLTYLDSFFFRGLKSLPLRFES